MVKPGMTKPFGENTLNIIVITSYISWMKRFASNSTYSNNIIIHHSYLIFHLLLNKDGLFKASTFLTNNISKIV